MFKRLMRKYTHVLFSFSAMLDLNRDYQFVRTRILVHINCRFAWNKKTPIQQLLFNLTFSWIIKQIYLVFSYKYWYKTKQISNVERFCNFHLFCCMKHMNNSTIKTMWFFQNNMNNHYNKKCMLMSTHVTCETVLGLIRPVFLASLVHFSLRRG